MVMQLIADAHDAGLTKQYCSLVSSCAQAVTTAVGLEFGLASSLFAVALCFTLVTMYDAAGVRYHSGRRLHTLYACFLLMLDSTTSYTMPWTKM